MLNKVAKKEPGKATRASVRKERAKPRMAIETSAKETNECQVKK